MLAEAIYPTVAGARDTAIGLAGQYYADITEQNRPDVAGVREYPVDALEEGLAPFLPDGEHLNRTHVGRITDVAIKHVEDAARRSTIRLVLDDETDEVQGWTRIDPNPPTCAFCLVLIARGPVYKSAESAGMRTQWHPKCSCKVVPVFSRNNWEGREQTLAANRIYTDAIRKYGNSINAVRKALAELERDEDGQVPLPIAA